MSPPRRGARHACRYRRHSLAMKRFEKSDGIWGVSPLWIREKRVIDANSPRISNFSNIASVMRSTPQFQMSAPEGTPDRHNYIQRLNFQPSGYGKMSG